MLNHIHRSEKTTTANATSIATVPGRVLSCPKSCTKNRKQQLDSASAVEFFEIIGCWRSTCLYNCQRYMNSKKIFSSFYSSAFLSFLAILFFASLMYENKVQHLGKKTEPNDKQWSNVRKITSVDVINATQSFPLPIYLSRSALRSSFLILNK